MSFAEGFGSAFSKSFNAGLEREEEKKKDQFRIAYADLVERRKERETNKAKEAAQIKQAQSITGLAGAPAEAWPKVFEMLNSGISPDKIREDIAAGTFNIGGSKPKAPTTASTGEAAPMDAIDVPAGAKPTPEAAFPTEGVAQQPTPEAPVDQQMQGTGMAPKAPTPPAPVGPTAPAAPKKNMFTGLLSDLSGKFKGGATKAPTATGAPNPANNDAYARIGKGLNQTPEQVSETINAPMYQVGQGVPDASNIQFTPARAAPKDEIKDIDGAYRAEAMAAQRLKANPQDAVAIRDYENAKIAREATEAAVTFQATAKARGEQGLARGVPAAVTDPNTGETATVPVNMEPDGNYINAITGQPIRGSVLPYSPEETKLLADIGKTYTAGVKETREKVAKVAPMLRSVGVLSQLADETNGAVLQPWSSGMARGLVGLAKETGNVLDLISSAPEITPEMVEQLRAAMPPAGTDLTSWLGADINNLAAKSALFEAQKTLFAYDVAASQGQTGQGLSNKDFAVIKETIAGAQDIPTFKQQMANVVNQQISNIQASQGAINEYNGMVDMFRTVSGKPNPYKPVELSLDKLISEANDPMVMRGLNLIRDLGKAPNGQQMTDQAKSNQGAPAQQVTAPAGMKQVGTTPSGQPVFEDAQGNRFTP